MKRATITLPNDLAEALEAYRLDQEVPPPLTAVAQVALKEYLAARLSGIDPPPPHHPGATRQWDERCEP